MNHIDQKLAAYKSIFNAVCEQYAQWADVDMFDNRAYQTFCDTVQQAINKGWGDASSQSLEWRAAAEIVRQCKQL